MAQSATGSINAEPRHPAIDTRPRRDLLALLQVFERCDDGCHVAPEIVELGAAFIWAITAIGSGVAVGRRHPRTRFWPDPQPGAATSRGARPELGQLQPVPHRHQ